MFNKIAAALLSCASTAALFACVPATSDAALPAGAASGGGGENSLAVRPVKTQAEIDGQWDIVSFDGYTIERRMAGSSRTAFADFGNGQVSLRIECNHSGAAGAVREGRFVSQPGDQIQTLIGCGEERHRRDAALFSFFARNPTADFLSDGRLRFTAGDTVLLLERPEQRRLAYLPSPPQLMGEWRLVELARYDSGGMAGIGLSEVPGRVVFDGMKVSYSRCPAYDFPYRYTKDGRIEKTGGAALPDAAPADCRELKNAHPGTRLPTGWDVMRALHGNPLLEMSDPDTLLVATDTLRLVLTKAPCERLDQSNDHAVTTLTDCTQPR